MKLCKYLITHQTFNLFVNIITSVETLGFCFYSINRNPFLLIFFFFGALIICDLTVGTLLSCFTCPLDAPVSVFEPFFTFEKDAPGSFCTFPGPALKSAISPMNSDSFYWKIAFRNQDVGAMCDHHY